MGNVVLRCGRCGETTKTAFHPSVQAQGVSNWCKACYREWHRSRYTPSTGATDDERACAHCGAVYRPIQRRLSWYCSQRCQEDADNAKRKMARRRAKEAAPPRWCPTCGTQVPASKRSVATFCSSGCNDAAHAVTRRMAQRHRRATPDRDTLVLRAVIAERCGWRCKLCGGRIAQWRRHPDPLVLSIDHIVPLAKFGGNDDENLQASHLICNLRKGAIS